MVWFSFKQCWIFFSDRTRKSHRKIIFKKCAEITYPISISQFAPQIGYTLKLTKYLKGTINFVISSGCISVINDHLSPGTESRRNSGLPARLRRFRSLELGRRKEEGGKKWDIWERAAWDRLQGPRFRDLSQGSDDGEKNRKNKTGSSGATVSDKGRKQALTN